MILFSIVVYNDFEVTCRYIENIRNLYIDNYKIIILDNYTEHDEIVKKEILLRIKELDANTDSLLYIFSGRNLGYGAGNNYIFNYAISNRISFEYFIISNSDVEIDKKDDIIKLVNILNSNIEIGVIGPKIILPNSQTQGPFNYQTIYKRYISLIFYPIIKIINKKYFDEAVNVKSSGFYYRLMGCFLIIKKDDYQKIKGFDENIFLYGEELILSERLKLISKKCYYENEVIIKHDHNTTTAKHFDQRNRKKMEFKSLIYYYRNYRKTSQVKICLSKISFSLFINFYYNLQLVLNKYIKK